MEELLIAIAIVGIIVGIVKLIRADTSQDRIFAVLIILLMIYLMLP